MAIDGEAAKAVVNRIERTVDHIQTRPLAGGLGTVPGTREIVVPGIPYVVVYRVMESEVQILRVWHARQQFH